MAKSAGQDAGEPPKKPSLYVQAAKALSQLALAFYMLLLAVVFLATSGSAPAFPLMMAALALVPIVFGPGMYRAIGLAALLVAGGLYLASKPPAQRHPSHSSPGAPAVAHAGDAVRIQARA